MFTRNRVSGVIIMGVSFFSSLSLPHSSMYWSESIKYRLPWHNLAFRFSVIWESYLYVFDQRSMTKAISMPPLAQGLHPRLNGLPKSRNAVLDFKAIIISPRCTKARVSFFISQISLNTLSGLNQDLTDRLRGRIDKSRSLWLLFLENTRHTGSRVWKCQMASTLMRTFVSIFYIGTN